MTTHLNIDAIADKSIPLSKLSEDIKQRVEDNEEVVAESLTMLFEKVNGLKVEALTEITYEELVELRDNELLIPGQQYRITNYVTTTAQTRTISAGHRFDVIVTADNASTLNENARAIKHDGEDYFNDCNLSSWEIKYCLDNDTTRFAWATESYSKTIDGNSAASYVVKLDNTIHSVAIAGKTFTLNIGEKTQIISGPPVYVTLLEGGKSILIDDMYNYLVSNHLTVILQSTGVIYYMKDEYNNECPYDFKNIQFNHPYDATTYPDYYYTFTNLINNSVNDLSLLQKKCYGNIIKTYTNYHNANKIELNRIVFLNTNETSACHSNIFGDNCRGISFGDSCYSNIFMDECYVISFGNTCYKNSFGIECSNITFGDECYTNSFGNGCVINEFGDKCAGNSFGDFCSDNTFGDECSDNSFGNTCGSNEFGNKCKSNTFGNECSYNSFGNRCGSSGFKNSFGNECSYNSFGNNCGSNEFGTECSNNSFENECMLNKFGNNCQYNSFGNQCYGISFRATASNSGTLLNYCMYNRFDDGVSIKFYNNSGATTMKNIHVIRGVYYTNFVFIGVTNSYNEICVSKGNNGVHIDYGSNSWKHVTANTTLTYSDKHIVLDNTSAITITLPTTPWDGAEFYLHKRSSTSAKVTISAGSGIFLSYGHDTSTTEARATSTQISALGTHRIIWDPSANEWMELYIG